MQHRTIRHGLVDSTNERALNALHDGSALHGDVYVADGQTGGRGRLGRHWVSPLGEGLYLSLVVRPARMPVVGGLTLSAGLAVLDACRACGLDALRLDWPNDVVAGSAKLAGVLVESRGLDPNEPAWVVGVGVNVAQREFPESLTRRRAVTSMALLGCTVTAREVETALVDALRRRVDAVLAEPGPTFTEAFGALVQGGRMVRVDVAGEQAQGRFVGLDAQRGLCLERGGARAWVPLAHVRAVETDEAAGA